MKILHTSDWPLGRALYGRGMTGHGCTCENRVKTIIDEHPHVADIAVISISFT